PSSRPTTPAGPPRASGSGVWSRTAIRSPSRPRSSSSSTPPTSASRCRTGPAWPSPASPRSTCRRSTRSAHRARGALLLLLWLRRRRLVVAGRGRCLVVAGRGFLVAATHGARVDEADVDRELEAVREAQVALDLAAGQLEQLERAHLP